MAYKSLIILSILAVVYFSTRKQQDAASVAKIEKTPIVDSSFKAIVATKAVSIRFGDSLRLDTSGTFLLPYGNLVDSLYFDNIKVLNLAKGIDSMLFKGGAFKIKFVSPLSPSKHGGLASSYVLYVLKEKGNNYDRLYISGRNLKDFYALSPDAPLLHFRLYPKNKLEFSVQQDTATEVFRYTFTGKNALQMQGAEAQAIADSLKSFNQP